MPLSVWIFLSYNVMLYFEVTQEWVRYWERYFFDFWSSHSDSNFDFYIKVGQKTSEFKSVSCGGSNRSENVVGIHRQTSDESWTAIDYF